MSTAGELSFVPMHKRRPARLEEAIDKTDAEARALPLPPLGYQFEGQNMDYFFVGPEGLPMHTRQLLSGKEKLRILDIGAGQGGFVLLAQQLGHTAHALTLHDYRGTREAMIAERLQLGTYVIGNAERLAEIDGLLPGYDVIVSSATFWWLSDPLGTLEQVADKVAPGGKLAIDHLAVNDGLNQDTNRLTSAVSNVDIDTELTRAGFISTRVDGERFKSIYAERPRGIGIAAARAAFAMNYELSPGGRGWRYVTGAPTLELESDLY